jgi:hypothetical protein
MRKVVEALVCPEMYQFVIIDVESSNLREWFAVDLTAQYQWFFVSDE